jgi:3-isopropylmalate/(R)-2-methylmalate dehydratase small subunit
MKGLIRGRALKVGDNINTDYIIPARYLDVYEPKELAAHLFEGLGSDYPQRAKGCVVLVAGKNLGSGSAREQAPNALKGAGFRVIIAKSIARIFYRNAINVGLPVIRCPEIVDVVNDGDELFIDLNSGMIQSTANGGFAFPPFPEPVGRVLKAGGMFPLLAKMAPRLLKRQAGRP